MTGTQVFQEHFFSTNDGRRLHYRDYFGPASRTPVICIPGMQTNLRSFELIAPHMAKSRRVLCIDPRGRGRSEYDSDPENYRLRREAADTFQMANFVHVSRAVVLGASRGGLSGLLLSANTQLAAGLILVDIGPQIELAAMERLVQDIAPNVSFPNWDAAANALKGRHGAWFPNLPDEKWRFWAETIYKEQDGCILPDSDPRLSMRARQANETGSEGARLALWQMFRRMPRLPILVLRGEHSDVLSEQTVAAMKSIRPAVVAVTVKDRGHRPFLDEPESLAALDTFLERIP